MTAPTAPPWIAAAVGPRQPGGRYQGAWGGPYTVLAVDIHPYGFQITEAFDGEARPRIHSEPWNPLFDTVIAQPDNEAVAA